VGSSASDACTTAARVTTGTPRASVWRRWRGRSTVSLNRHGAHTQKSTASRYANSGWSRSSRADAAPDTVGALGGGTENRYPAAIAAGAGVTGRHCVLTTGGLIGVRRLVAWRVLLPDLACFTSNVKRRDLENQFRE
jgi:hypothetical protein